MKKLNNAQLFVMQQIIAGQYESLRVKPEDFTNSNNEIKTTWTPPAGEIVNDFIAKGFLEEENGTVVATETGLALDLKQNPWDNPLGYMNHYMYSDVSPFEIVEKVHEKRMIIRRMDVNASPLNNLTFHIGGFSAHCSDQRAAVYLIESNPENPTTIVRWSEAKQVWQANGNRFHISDSPIYFYDYNF
jgi:hypothetical protein